MLPAEQLADDAYVSGDNLAASHARNIDLIGPAYQDKGWQAKAGEGFDVANFNMDWNKKVVRCPEGAGRASSGHRPGPLENGT